MAQLSAILYSAVALLAYLLGSFPTGYLIGRTRGIDVRQHGSGNIGATNVLRVLGKGPGIFVFICDAFKGWFSVWLALRMTSIYAANDPVWAGIVAGMACIMGHNYPIWLGFRGGKGVATTIGVLIGLMPAAVVGSALVWAVVFFTARYVSLASMLAAASLPISVAALRLHRNSDGLLSDPMFWFSIVAALLIFWRHQANIGRLWRGVEPRFDRKTPRPAASS